MSLLALWYSTMPPVVYVAHGDGNLPRGLEQVPHWVLWTCVTIYGSFILWFLIDARKRYRETFGSPENASRRPWYRRRSETER